MLSKTHSYCDLIFHQASVFKNNLLSYFFETSLNENFQTGKFQFEQEQRNLDAIIGNRFDR